MLLRISGNHHTVDNQSPETNYRASKLTWISYWTLSASFAPEAHCSARASTRLANGRCHSKNATILCSAGLRRGECQLLRPGNEPVRVRKEDFVLIRTVTPFTLASMGSIEPIDSEAAVLASRRQRLRLGSGDERPVTLHAGKFVVESVNEGLLSGLLPQLIHLAAGDPALGRVRSLLEMNETEARQPGPAS